MAVTYETTDTSSTLSVELGESDLDTSEKSLVKINSTTYNIYDSWMEFVRKYFGIDELDNPYINTLKASFFGYFNEIASSEIKNAVYHKNFLYDEHFLNTAVLPESIYNFAKIYNVEMENAEPATLYVSLGFIESELVRFALLQEEDTDAITNANSNTLKCYSMTLERTALFNVEGYSFLLPYPLKITIQELSDDDDNTSYSYTAVYDTTANNFPPLENDGITPYLKIWRETVDDENMLYIGCQIYQLEKQTTTVTITSTEDNPDTIYHDISFDNQLCYFEAFYEYGGETTQLNTYFNNIYTPSEEEYFCYYTYITDNMIQLSFSSQENAFKPVAGSTLTVDVYNSLGSEGNFDYSGSVTLSIKQNDTFTRMTIDVNTTTTGSEGGKDRLDTTGQKTLILERITTRNNIITENDLLKFFDSINESLNINGSTIKFLKKQDDVIKRIYCNFLLLRDENKRVIPTNTAPYITFKESDLTGDNYVIKEHSIVTCNYVRDIVNDFEDASDEIEDLDTYLDQENNIRLSQDYVTYTLDNSYFADFITEYEKEHNVNLEDYSSIMDVYTKMNLLECKSDLLVYTIPFMISIEKEPFLRATYYNMDIDDEFNMEYYYLNSKVGASFNISTITIEKDASPSIDNKYTLESNIYKLSFNLNTNLSYTELKEKVVVRCNIYNDDDQMVGFFLFDLKEAETDNTGNITSYSYEYYAELSTEYAFDGQTGDLYLYNSLYNSTAAGDAILIKNVGVTEDIKLRIGILYYDEDGVLTNSQTDAEKDDFNTNLPSLYFTNIEYTSDTLDLSGNTVLSTMYSYFSALELDLDGENINFDGSFSYNYLTGLALIPSNFTHDEIQEAAAAAVSLVSNSDTATDDDGILKFLSELNLVSSDGSLYGLYSKFTLSDSDVSNSRSSQLVFKLKDESTNASNNTLGLQGEIKIVITNCEYNNIYSNFEIAYKFNFAAGLIVNDDETSDKISITRAIEDDEVYYYITLYNYKDYLNSSSNDNDDNIIISTYSSTAGIYDNTGEDAKYSRYNNFDKSSYESSLVLAEALSTITNNYTVYLNLYSYSVAYTNSSTGAIVNSSDTFGSSIKVDSAYFIMNEEESTSAYADLIDIDNYCVATILQNSDSIKLYQNMSDLMNSIITYDEDNEEYKLELVPLVGLRYYMARPKVIYNLLNQFITVIDENLPRLENNTKCDMKFYNTYGPSRYFYFEKENYSENIYTSEDGSTTYTDSTFPSDENPYQYVTTTENLTKYNYLGRTDVILDFTIYTYETITEEKDEEIKKYISDYIEDCNTQLIFPISNLITLLQNNFPIIKYIKYNGIFSDIVDSNSSSKNNDYQIVDNDFDFDDMTKEEIRVYVPEYLNLKKDVINNNTDEIDASSITADEIISIFEYGSYDYVINISYK